MVIALKTVLERTFHLQASQVAFLYQVFVVKPYLLEIRTVYTEITNKFIFDMIKVFVKDVID